MSSFVKSTDLRPCTLVRRSMSSRINGNGVVFLMVNAFTVRNTAPLLLI